MTKVKICGITNLDDARHAVECGADELGFNFYEKSPRYVAPGSVHEMILKLPKGTRTVGVFVNKVADDVVEIAMRSSIDVVQLHGDEGPRDVEFVQISLGLDVIKSFSVDSSFDLESITKFEECSILVDAKASGQYGGTGKLADWNIASKLVDNGNRVYLAGGLNAKNVADAIRAVRPYAVDVASGVESSPGKKDPRKVEAFIKAVMDTAISY